MTCSGFAVDQLVEDLDGQQVVADVHELLGASGDRLRAAHHLDSGADSLGASGTSVAGLPSQ